MSDAITNKRQPESWLRTTVGNVFDVVGGGTPSTKRPDFWNGTIAWITSADIDDDHNITPRKRITEKAIEASATTPVPAGSVIVVTRVGLGKVGVAKEPLCFSQDSQALLFDPTLLDTWFVAHQMSQAVSVFKHVGRGTTISGVTKRQLNDIAFYLVPFNEQRRIVAEIEKQFARLDEAVDALQRIVDDLKQYRTSVLKAACEGRLVSTEAELAQSEGRDYEPASTLLQRILAERRAKWEADQLERMRAQGREPENNKWKTRYVAPQEPGGGYLRPNLKEGWTWASFEQLAADEKYALKAGPFGSSLKKSSYVESGYKIYGQEQVIMGDPFYGDYYISERHYQELASCAVKPYDLLISLVGTAGRVLILPEGIEPGIINPRLLKLTLNRHVADVNYIKIFLESPIVKNYFSLVSHGGTMDILNLGILKSLAIPLPPLVEQKRIVNEVEKHLHVADELEEFVAATLDRAEELRRAILKRAFEGRLVPQDPKDESAAVLLERIAVERQRRRKEAMKEKQPSRTKKKYEAETPSLFTKQQPSQANLLAVFEHHNELSTDDLFALAGYVFAEDDRDVESFYTALTTGLQSGELAYRRTDNDFLVRRGEQ